MSQIKVMSIDEASKLDNPKATILFEMQRNKYLEDGSAKPERVLAFGVNGCKIAEMGFIAVQAPCVGVGDSEAKAGVIAQAILDDTIRMYREKINEPAPTHTLSIIEGGQEHEHSY